MEIEREGLHTYGVTSFVQNTYFLSVEYQTIRYNHPDTLLPLLIREQDGNIRLLYDISEAKSLAMLSKENNSHGNNFSKEDCRCLLKNMQKLLIELEKLMLSPTHINFSPECVYRTGESTFRWMYCPDEQFDMEKEVQQFFSWMLSEINYGDSATVRYIYHVYWLVRNRNFSEKLIQECLDYDEEAPKITSYESFFAQETVRGSSVPKYELKTRKPEEGEKRSEQPAKNKNRGMKVAEAMLWIAAVGAGVTVVVFGIYLFWKGMVPLSSRSWLGCVVLLIVAIEVAFQLRSRRKALLRDGGTNTAKEPSSPCSPQVQFFRENKEGTVRLDAGIRKKHPFLKSEQSGELFPLQSFPYYIGNDRGLNQLTIYDKTVSRKHAVIDKGPIPGTYLLKDLQSTNGTWVNHVRIQKEAVELREGDRIQFAAHMYRFEISEDCMKMK